MATIDTEDVIETPPVLGKLSSLIDARPEGFIRGDEEIRKASLEAAKYVFDLGMSTPLFKRPLN